MDLVKDLLKVIKKLSKKEEALMNFLSVDTCEPKFLVEELDGLYDIIQAALGILNDDPEMDDFLRIAVDYVLDGVSLEDAVNQLKQLKG